jgi:hypothetical protein
VAFAVENLRLKELAIITEKNRPVYDDFVGFLKTQGYKTLHEFVVDTDVAKPRAAIVAYLKRALPGDVKLYDGVARPYKEDTAKWFMLGWIFRDAPVQRLRPMVPSMEGATVTERQATLLNQLRIYVATIFPQAPKWEWAAISEVVLDRLEGSRRAIKGTLFEAIVRRHLEAIFEANKLSLKVNDVEIRIEGETFDVSVVGKKSQLLIPVKTRETMGGGHALLFTRDIHKAISAATDAGFECLPVIIAESWGGDLKSLASKDFIYIAMNPNQVIELEPILAAELGKRIELFRSLT